MKNNQLVAFVDFDKTIYDLQIPHFEEYRKTLSKNVEEKFDVRDNFHPILENTEKMAALNAEIKKYVYESIDELEENATGHFYPYAESLLKKLSAEMPVLVVSNNSGAVISKRLREQQLHRYIQYVYGRGTFDYFKPMGEVLSYCCEQINLSPKSINKFVYYGDSWRDYKCAADFAAKSNLNYTFINANTLSTDETIY